jgi:ribosomal protein S18 acetylase RimI-like enzyme
LIARPPTLDEYQQLCHAVGWSAVINFAVASAALAQSVTAVVARTEQQTIGMGRIVGDGAIYFYIQDVAVLPAHQHRGVGQRIMDHLLAYLATAAPAQAFIGVFAAQGTESFYQRYGFQTYPALTGMFQVAPVASHRLGNT